MFSHRHFALPFLLLVAALAGLLFVVSGCSSNGTPTANDPDPQSSIDQSSATDTEQGSSDSNTNGVSSSKENGTSTQVDPDADLSQFDLDSGNGAVAETGNCGDESGEINADNGCIRYTGRVLHNQTDHTVKFNWPGIVIEANFQGTSLSVDLSAADNVWFDAYIDGEKIATISPPDGKTNDFSLGSLRAYANVTRYLLANSLAEGEHTFKLVKRSETNFNSVTLNKIILDEGKKLLPLPPRPTMKIEIIGDSYSVGYGVESPSKNDPSKQDASGRNCNDEEFHAYTNSARAYGAIAAQLLEAEYQLNAYSGLGMVRNYSGNTSYHPFPEYYGRVLQDNESVKYDPNSWHPDFIIILLGTNDYSTPLSAGEAFSSREALYTAYRTAYHKFLATLRALHPNVQFILGATNLWDEVAGAPNTEFTDQVNLVIQEEQAAGHNDLHFQQFTNTSGYGCGWHPDISTQNLWGTYLSNRIKSL